MITMIKSTEQDDIIIILDSSMLFNAIHVIFHILPGMSNPFVLFNLIELELVSFPVLNETFLLILKKITVAHENLVQIDM